MRIFRTPLIAIVDDDPRACRALQRLVWAHGIDSEVFCAGREFLDILETVPSFQPKSVVLDVDMPGLDGFEVRKRLAAMRPGLPVIFLTAGSTDETPEAMACGEVAGFFRKPLHDDLVAFLKTLRRVLGLDFDVKPR